MVRALRYIPLVAVACLVAALLSAPSALADGTDQAAQSITYEKDGVVAEAKTLQKALNKARGSDTVVTVRLGSGTYKLTSKLHIYSNTRLVLDKDAVILRSKSMINTPMMHNYPVERVKRDDPSMTGYSMSRNITIEGGTFDGGKISKATKDADLVRIDHARDIVVKSVSFRNVYGTHLLELAGVKNATVTKCSFTGFRNVKGWKWHSLGSEAVQLDSDWTDTPRKPQASPWVTGVVLDGTRDVNCSVTECTFTDMPAAVGQHHSSSSCRRSSNIVIAGNVIKSSSSDSIAKSAITCVGMNKVTIRNNKVSGVFRHAVMLGDAKQVAVKGNSFSKMSSSGVWVFGSARNATVSGNTIKSCGGSGVFIENGRVVKVLRNQIRSCRANGVYAYSGKKLTVQRNRVASCKGSGVLATYAKGLSVARNRFVWNSGYGVRIGVKAKQVSVKRNRFYIKSATKDAGRKRAVSRESERTRASVKANKTKVKVVGKR